MSPKLGISFLKELALFIRNPQDTPQLFRIVEAFFGTLSDGQRKKLEALYLRDRGFRDMYRQGAGRFLDTPFELSRMERMPEGTLGREVAKLIRANGFETEFFKRFGEDRVIDYFATRLAKTHDVWHVLTGFRPDIPGEMALMAFYLSQIASPFPLSLVIGGVLHLLGARDVLRLRSAFHQVIAGYRHGRRAKRLYGVVWEDLWEEPVEKVRRRFWIVPYRDGERVRVRLNFGLSLEMMTACLLLTTASLASGKTPPKVGKFDPFATAVVTEKQAAEAKPEAKPEEKPKPRTAEDRRALAEKLALNRPLGWSRAEADVFGCFLETKLKVKVPRYGCKRTKPLDVGDPCKNTDAYYAGPEFPKDGLSAVHPDVRAIALTWEHGELQHVSITFKAKKSEEMVRKTFAIPADVSGLEPPVTHVAIDTQLGQTALNIEGFDHMGAGDVECP